MKPQWNTVSTSKRLTKLESLFSKVSWSTSRRSCCFSLLLWVFSLKIESKLVLIFWKFLQSCCVLTGEQKPRCFVSETCQAVRAEFPLSNTKQTAFRAPKCAYVHTVVNFQESFGVSWALLVWSPLWSWIVTGSCLVTARTGNTTWVLLRHRKTNRYTSGNSKLNACFLWELVCTHYAFTSVFCFTHNWLTAAKKNDQAFELQISLIRTTKTPRTSWSWPRNVGKQTFWLCVSFRSADGVSLRLHLSSYLNNKFQISRENDQNWAVANFECWFWRTSRCLFPTRPVFSESLGLN